MTESSHNSNDSESLMSDYIDGQLAPAQCAEVEAFLADDAEAAQIMDELIAIQSGLKSFKKKNWGLSLPNKCLVRLPMTVAVRLMM